MRVATAHMMEELVKLEAQHGATPNESPAIDEVLKYLTRVNIITIYYNTNLYSVLS